MKKFIIKLFTRKHTYVTFFRGNKYDIQAEYQQFLNRGPEIISTSICHDYAGYGYNDPFLLVVTYKK